VDTRRKSLRNGWLGLVLAWSVVRIAGAGIVLRPYHVHLWGFAIIEFVSSPILAMASARLVYALRDHQLTRAALAGVVSLVAFAAPDVYLLRSGRGLPWVAYAVVIGLMLCGATVSVVGLRRQLLETSG
jgi:hypothetical protein